MINAGDKQRNNDFNIDIYIDAILRTSSEKLAEHELNCLGSLLVSSVNHELRAGGACAKCGNRSECNTLVNTQRTAPTFMSCFGSYCCGPACTTCKIEDECCILADLIKNGIQPKTSTPEPEEVTHRTLAKEPIIDPITPIEITERKISEIFTAPKLTLSVTSKEKEVTAEISEPIEAGNYKFPYQNPIFIAELDIARLLDDEELRSTFLATTEAANNVETYIAHRAKLCAQAVALNERQHLPPVFRSKPCNIKRGEKSPPIEKRLASNDRQVIDMHWLHCDGFVPSKTKWASIFGEIFCFLSASDFVQRVGSSSNKSVDLGLARQEMLLLSVIRNSTISDRQIKINDIIQRGKAKIRELKRNPKCRIPCPDDEMINVCHAILLSDLEDKSAIKILQQTYKLEYNKQTIKRRRVWLLENKIIHPLGS